MEFRDRRVERAHKRYLAAIKAFAQVRRLQLPPVAQLNMAQQQVNITEVAQPDQG